jgi:hypothetical protein
MKNCVFCKIIRGKEPARIVYEDKDVICFLPTTIQVYGHTLVVPKKHYKDLYDIPEKLLSKLIITAKKLTLAYKKKIGATGVNYFMPAAKMANNLFFIFTFIFFQDLKMTNAFIRGEKTWIRKGKIAVLIYCGSRGLGHQVATDYICQALNYIDKQNTELIDRELDYFPYRHPEGQNYLSAMKASANFAFANRQLILHQVRKAFKKVFGKEVKIKQVYDVTHNIVKIE